MTTEIIEHSEHRSEHRFRQILEVRAGTLEMATANVSLHGMQLVCPLMRFNRIKEDVRKGELGVQVVLPKGVALDARLLVRYCSSYGDEVLIGVRTEMPDPAAQAQWAAHIGELSKGPRFTP